MRRRSIHLFHVLHGLGFILINFATPIAFYIMFHAQGAKPAIALAIGVTCLQLAAHWILRLSFSPFFITASGFTVGFGMIDLFLATPRFFRLEPFAQNFLMGSVFLVTVLTGTPLARWFAMALPEMVRPDLSAGSARYLRNVTLVWTAYFFAKALVFLWLALKVDLGSLIVLRSLIGGVSLAAMFAGEVIYRKWIRGK